MTNDADLLRQYASTGSETAFEQLVQRHLPLVYSAALRMVGGDEALAQDVAQTVFIDLARKARSLLGREMLAGWLHAGTRLAASNAVRAERRRRHREAKAASMREPPSMSAPDPSYRAELRPVLDEVLSELSGEDRDALLLRFFQGKQLREVGAALNISEDAARMRVNRSLGKLQALLAARGIALPVAAVATLLADEAVSGAPAGLAATITQIALAGAKAAGVGTGVTSLLTMTKLKVGIAGAILLAGIAAPMLIQRQSAARLLEKDEALRRQSERLAELRSENERLSNLTVQATAPRPIAEDQLHELLKLRDEVTRLRADAQAQSKQAQSGTLDAEAGRLLSKVRLLRQGFEEMPDKRIPELRFLDDQAWMRIASQTKGLDTEAGLREGLCQLRTAAKEDFCPKLAHALEAFVRANNGQLPADPSQLGSYFDPPVEDSVLERYKMLKAGDARALKPTDMLIAEKAPVDDQYDVLFQVGLHAMHSEGIGADSHAASTSAWAEAPTPNPGASKP